MTPNKRISVLYAEEDEDCGFMLTVLLGFSEIDVHWVQCVTDALHKARKRRFDLFLLSSVFTDGNGYELCRKLRADFPQIPVVFYSGEAYEINRQMGMKAGANAYLIKPEVNTVAPTILEIVEPGEEAAHVNILISQNSLFI